MARCGKGTMGDFTTKQKLYPWNQGYVEVTPHKCDRCKGWVTEKTYKWCTEHKKPVICYKCNQLAWNREKFRK